MTVAQINGCLIGGMVAGLLSLPTTWFTIRGANIEISPQFNSPLFDSGSSLSNAFNTAMRNRTIEVTGLNGHVTLLVKLPIWLVVTLAIAAGAFQLADNLTGVDFPGVGLWAIGLIALVWVILPTVIALASGDATPGVGWLLGVVAAVTPIAMLWIRKRYAADSSDEPREA